MGGSKRTGGPLPNVPVLSDAVSQIPVIGPTIANVGFGKLIQDHAEEERKAEEAKRLDAYNTSIQDTTVDSISRNEIAALYAQGASSAALSDALNKARTGKGIYAVRKIDEAQKNQRANQPGRAQTTNTLGYTRPLGA